MPLGTGVMPTSTHRLDRFVTAIPSADTGPMKKNRTNYHRHRFPPAIISHAVSLYYRFTLSLLSQRLGDRMFDDPPRPFVGDADETSPLQPNLQDMRMLVRVKALIGEAPWGGVTPSLSANTSIASIAYLAFVASPVKVEAKQPDDEVCLDVIRFRRGFPGDRSDGDGSAGRSAR